MFGPAITYGAKVLAYGVNLIGTAIGKVASAISSVLGPVVSYAGSVIGKFASFVGSALSKVASGAGSLASSAGSAAYSVASTALSALGTIASTVVSGLIAVGAAALITVAALGAVVFAARHFVEAFDPSAVAVFDAAMRDLQAVIGSVMVGAVGMTDLIGSRVILRPLRPEDWDVWREEIYDNNLP